ncbi:MAG: hypothetical protein JRF25_12805 [Deltaproteobacteria bacterium]|nr:hypothetical protein [Deltaproteobacteria bacterium]
MARKRMTAEERKQSIIDATIKIVSRLNYDRATIAPLLTILLNIVFSFTGPIRFSRIKIKIRALSKQWGPSILKAWKIRK